MLVLEPSRATVSDRADEPVARGTHAPQLPLGHVLAAVGGLYIGQSVVGGITFVALPSLLRTSGLPLDLIGLTFLAALPWVFKFVWAPAVERVRLPRIGQSRSRVIVAAGTVVVAVLVSLAGLLGPTAFIPLLACFTLAALAAATVDIACDGYAVQALPENARGWGNTAQVGGAYIGSAVGGGLLLALVALVGWQVALLAMAAVIVVLAVPFVAASEPAVGRPERSHHPSLAAALKRGEIRVGLMVTILFAAGQKLAQAMLGPFLIDAGLDLTTLGLLNGFGGTLLGIVGSLLGGGLVRSWGADRAIRRAILLQGVLLLALALIAASGVQAPALLAGFICLNTAATALGFVALFTLLMGYAAFDQGGVDFTLFQCADGMLAMVGGLLGGFLSLRLGYPACFALAAGLAALAALLIPTLLAQAARSRQDQP